LDEISLEKKKKKEKEGEENGIYALSKLEHEHGLR